MERDNGEFSSQWDVIQFHVAENETYIYFK